MNISINIAMNMSFILSNVFKEMESPYWSLSYDPYVLNAFKLMINRSSNVNQLSDIHPLPDGIHAHYLGTEQCCGKYGPIKYTRVFYNIFIYEFNNNVLSWLMDIYPKIPQTWDDYAKQFYYVNYESEHGSRDSKDWMYMYYTNPREYLTQRWLDMILSANFNTPYHFECATKHFNDDITYNPEKRSRRHEVYHLGF